VWQSPGAASPNSFADIIFAGGANPYGEFTVKAVAARSVGGAMECAVRDPKLCARAQQKATSGLLWAGGYCVGDPNGYTNAADAGGTPAAAMCFGRNDVSSAAVAANACCGCEAGLCDSELVANGGSLFQLKFDTPVGWRGLVVGDAPPLHSPITIEPFSIRNDVAWSLRLKNGFRCSAPGRRAVGHVDDDVHDGPSTLCDRAAFAVEIECDVDGCSSRPTAC
jgi:hypothetical protein